MVKPLQSFQVWIEPEVHAAREDLPGNIRQRVKRGMGALAREPRPSSSRSLNVEGLDIPPDVEIRRLCLEKWRILYAVNEPKAGSGCCPSANGRHVSMKICRTSRKN